MAAFIIKQEPLFVSDNITFEDSNLTQFNNHSDLFTSSMTCSINETDACSSNPIKQEFDCYSAMPSCNGATSNQSSTSVDDVLRLKFGIMPSFVRLTRISELFSVKLKTEENESQFDIDNFDDRSRTELVSSQSKCKNSKKRFSAHNITTAPSKRKMNGESKTNNSLAIDNNPKYVQQPRFQHFLGDLVWAKLENKPWWPSQICVSPESGDFKKIKISLHSAGYNNNILQYYITTFDSPSVSGWVPTNRLMNFRGRKRYEEFAALYPGLKKWFRVEDEFLDKWEETVKIVEEIHKIEIQKSTKDLNECHSSKESNYPSELFCLEKQILNLENERINLLNSTANNKSDDQVIRRSLRKEKELEEKIKCKTISQIQQTFAKKSSKEISTKTTKNALELGGCQIAYHLEGENIGKVIKPNDSVLSKTRFPQENEVNKQPKAIVNNRSSQKTNERGAHNTNIIKCEIKNGTIIVKGPQQKGFQTLMSVSASNPNLIIQATLTIDKVLKENV